MNSYISAPTEPFYMAIRWGKRFIELLQGIERITSHSRKGVRLKADIFRRGPNSQHGEYESIGVTAKLVAYYRSLADIPFAKDIAVAANAEKASSHILVKDKVLFWKAAVAFEARFKSINAVIEKYPDIKQFIEIPAGFSSRGLSMTLFDPAIDYTECDLPVILHEKQKQLLQVLKMRQRRSIPENLHFERANILDASQLANVARRFPAGPILIITEGLFCYLSHEEQIEAAKNVRRLLVDRRGVWLVTDLNRLFSSDDESAAEWRNRIGSATGFSPITGCFTSVEEAKRFFRAFGFKVRVYRRSAVIDKLSTLEASGFGKRKIRRFLRPQVTLALEI